MTNNSTRNLNWPTKKLGEICEFVFGFAFKASDFNSEGKGLPVIRIGDIDKECTDKFYDDPYDNRYLVNKGDILIGLSGSIKVAKWSGDLALLNQRVVKLNNFIKDMYPDFIYYNLPFLLYVLERNLAKLTIKNVLTRHLYNLDIPLPPLEIQKKIVAKIEELFSKIDKAIELRQKAMEETEQIFPSALQKIFTEAENNWGVRKIKDICAVNPSKTEIKTLPENLEVAFVPMSAVDDVSGTITKQDKKLLGLVKKGYTYFKDNDVLFAKITPCMENGKSAIANKLTNGIGFGSTEFHVIRPSKEILPQWIHSYIRQPWYRDEAKRYFTGSVGQQRVPEEFIKRTEIPLPPLPEQKKIVDYLDVLREKTEKLRELQQDQLSELKELKNSILDKAFKGELVS